MLSITLRRYAPIPISLLCLTILILPVHAGDPASVVNGVNVVNKDAAGLALQGYDPVAFFNAGKPVAGDPALTADHGGATYRFSSAQNRAAFQKDPARYLPAFGGYCAFGVAYGGLYPVAIETWQTLDGRLVLNKSPEVRSMFDKDPKGTLAKADANWPGLVEKQGK